MGKNNIIKGVLFMTLFLAILILFGFFIQNIFIKPSGKKIDNFISKCDYIYDENEDAEPVWVVEDDTDEIETPALLQ